MVEIYTDVSGVLTADPKIVKEAKPLSVLSYAEICNMAYNGARVIHPRAVEAAMQANLPLRVRSTFGEDEGTLVTHPETAAPQNGFRDRHVAGIAHHANISQMRSSPGRDRLICPLKCFAQWPGRRAMRPTV
jgi:aspartate kinase